MQWRGGVDQFAGVTRRGTWITDFPPRTTGAILYSGPQKLSLMDQRKKSWVYLFPAPSQSPESLQNDCGSRGSLDGEP